MTPPRLLLGRALAVGLTVAAGTAIFALLSGSFDETDSRIIGTSLGFSVFSATAAAGAALRRARRGREEVVGAAAAGLSAAAFLILVLCIWSPDADGPWRLWGVLAVCALVASHASLVLKARSPRDTDLVRVLVFTSITAACLDGLFGLAGITGLVDHISEGAVRVAAVAGVVGLLASALPPIIRRVNPSFLDRHEDPDEPSAELAAHVVEALDRIVALEPGPEIRLECARLRQTARMYGG